MNLTNATESAAFALRLARAAQELNDLRAILLGQVSKPYASAGCPGTSSLGTVESKSFDALDMSGDDVCGSLMAIAQRLDRDLASKL